MKYSESEKRLIKRFEKRFVYDSCNEICDSALYEPQLIIDFLIKEVRRNRRSAARLGLVPKDLG